MIARAHPSTQHANSSPANGAACDTLRSILVATDGSRTAGAALRIAAELARLYAANVTALTVLESAMSYLSDALIDHGDLRGNEVARNNVMDKVARQLCAVGLTHCAVRVAFGAPGQAIALTAKETQATLIIIGHGRHRLLPRLLGGETFADILPHAAAPILVVESTVRTLPKSIVCAVDFGKSSLSAVANAVQIAAPGATVHLVHVAAPGNALETGWQRVYASGVEDAFERVRQNVARSDVVVRTHLLFGDTQPVLRQFIARSGADLVALGAHNRPPLAAFLLGSVTTSLLRSEEVSLLVSPDCHASAAQADLRTFSSEHAEIGV